jgi:hypothetical protein
MTLFMYDILLNNSDDTFLGILNTYASTVGLPSDIFKPVRAVIVDGEVSSVCYYRFLEIDNKRYAELCLYSAGFEPLVTATQREHHHISVILEQKEEYLEAIGADAFLITSDRDEKVIYTRFPSAKLLGAFNAKYNRYEL